MSNLESRTVLVWRTDVLPLSETFITNHIDSLTRWVGVLVGVERVAELEGIQARTAFPATRAGRLLGKVFRKSARSRYVRSTVQGTDANLVHAHFGADATLIAPTCRALGLPLVVTLHGVDVTAQRTRRGVAGAVYRWRLRATLRQAAVVLPVSECIRDQALSAGSPRDRTVVHHLGIFVPAVKSVRPEERDIDVLFVGRLVEKKGVLQLLQALEEISRLGLVRSHRVRCTIIGNGPMLEAVLRHETSPYADVLAIGSKSREEVGQALDRARLLAIPSITAANGDTEGLPTVAMEAGAHGVPVVGYRHSGIPEVVVDGTTGLLCDEGDTAGLAQNIATLLVDERRRSELAEAARDHIAANFNIVDRTAKLEGLYDTILAGGASATRT